MTIRILIFSIHAIAFKVELMIDSDRVLKITVEDLLTDEILLENAIVAELS